MHEPERYTVVAKDVNSHAAMEEEMRALVKNQTWDLVDAPKGVKLIECRWVYKFMYNTDIFVNRYKARLVAKGYAQQHNIDYHKSSALVAKMTTVLVQGDDTCTIWTKEHVPARRA